MKNFEYCKYTYLHRRALLHYIQKNQYLTNDEKIILIERAKVHDMDKMTLYFFREKEKASKYHREHATHHIKHWKVFSVYDLLESIFDYECAALTKPDKPLNAYDTVLAYYADFKNDYLPILERLHMDESYLAVDEDDKKYIEKFLPQEADIISEIQSYLIQSNDVLYKQLWSDLCSEKEYRDLKFW